jgi:hypothetical protein
LLEVAGFKLAPSARLAAPTVALASPRGVKTAAHVAGFDRLDIKGVPPLKIPASLFENFRLAI